MNSQQQNPKQQNQAAQGNQSGRVQGTNATVDANQKQAPVAGQNKSQNKEGQERQPGFPPDIQMNDAKLRNSGSTSTSQQSGNR